MLRNDEQLDSCFFRDPSSVRSLREDVLPALLRRAAETRTLRIWNPACASGEDTYSLAILLQEVLPDYHEWFISLVGTDTNLGALTRARKAIYGRSSLRAMESAQRALYFHELEREHFQLKRKYQLDVTFHVHDLADVTKSAPPPGRFDLVFCRSTGVQGLELQARVATKIAASLAPEGVWIAGTAESTPARGFASRALPGVAERRVARGTPTREIVVTPARESAATPTRELAVTPSREAGVRRSPLPAAVEPGAGAQPPRPPRHAGQGNLETSELKESDAGPRPSEPSRDELASLRRLADGGNDAAASVRAGELIQQYPHAVEPYQVRAMLRSASGDDRGAVEDLRRVLYLDPTNLHARFRLGLSLVRCGDRAGARVALNALITMPVADEQAAEQLRAVAARHLLTLNQEDSRHE